MGVSQTRHPSPSHLALEKCLIESQREYTKLFEKGGCGPSGPKLVQDS